MENKHATSTVRPPVTAGFSADYLARYMRVSLKTMEGWMNGTTSRPPYFDAAVRAVRADLHGISPALACGYHEALGVSEEHASYWRKSGQVPFPARLAVAWIIHHRITGRD